MPHRLKGLYAITDKSLTPDETILHQVREALEAGVRIVQYRDKHASDPAIEATCTRLRTLCHDHDALFIIDDRPRLADKIKADGVHIGKDDIPLREARSLFPKGIIGVSCYGSVRKAQEAQEEGADYVAFGSFFPSPTKPNSGIVPVSLLEKAKARLSIPICAIGGIGPDNIHQIAAHRPDMISMVDAIFRDDIKTNIARLQKGMRR